MASNSQWYLAADLDPLAALHDAQLRPPVNIKPLASFRECRFLLPPSHEDYLSAAQEEARKREREMKKEDNAFRLVKPPPPYQGPSLLEQLEESSRGTIMECLGHWKSQGRVVVHLRDWGRLKSGACCVILVVVFLVVADFRQKWWNVSWWRSISTLICWCEMRWRLQLQIGNGDCR